MGAKNKVKYFLSSKYDKKGYFENLFCSIASCK